MATHYTLGVYDYDRNKLFDLYDSEVELVGQAFDIQVSTEMNGYHTLNFSIPYTIDAEVVHQPERASIFGEAIFGINKFGGTGRVDTRVMNFRWKYMRSDYLIRYTCDNETIWYVANKPNKSKSGKKIIGTVVCSGYESLLKTRSIYKEFDDENGIGNMGYLMEQILMGTGWHFDSAHSDTLYERDGVTERIRSLQNSSKKGALDLITSVCNLFQARPIYDTDTQTVTIKAMNNRDQVLEGEVGRNLSDMTVKEDSSDICTRVYIEGEYGDFGYVGIDDVRVDADGNIDDEGTEWGLPFLFDFDYYREIGAFKTTHEVALQTYLTNIRNIKAQIRAATADLLKWEDDINTLIGQCSFALYYKSNGLSTPAYTYGDPTSAQATLAVNDDVVILNGDGTLSYEKWTGNPNTQLSSAYGVVKFVRNAAGKIGAAEVQVEAKENEITKIQKKIDTLSPKDSKIATYEQEIARLQKEINTIFVGTKKVTGLNTMMHNVMKPAGMFYERDQIQARIDDLNDQQDDIEATFISAIGYMLRDGYWSNQNYTIGQEKFLYADAQDMILEMSRPEREISISYERLADRYDIQPEDIQINAIFKLYDEELDVEDKMFVKKVTYGVDNKKLGKIDLSNQDIALTGNDLGSLLSRMSQLADLIEQKNALYERAKAITASGSIYANRLNGQIDVLKTQIMSSVSNWHTDSNGNIIFISADENSAMMLSGAGFMLAAGKDENGNWDWRTKESSLVLATAM